MKKCLPTEKIEYTPNNIEFRINSSMLLAKFKNSQAQSFKELQYNRAGHKFSNTAKELVLLSYSVWSYFLISLEQKLIECHTLKRNLDVIKETLINGILQKEDCIKKLSKSSEFDQEFLELWLQVHERNKKFILSEIEAIRDANPTYLFTKLTNIIIDTLNEIVLETYEIDHLYARTNDTIILYIDDYLIKVSEKIGEDVFIFKLNKYIDYSKNSKGIIFKSYIPFQAVKELPVYKVAKEKFEYIDII